MQSHILLISLLFAYAHGLSPRLVDQVTVNKPGFATFIPTSQGRYGLAISSFSGAPFSKDNVYYISDYQIGGSHKVETLNNNGIVWPNEISNRQEPLFSSGGGYGGLVVPSGFLVPGKGNGGLYYYTFLDSNRTNITKSAPTNLVVSQDKQTWFYHRAKFLDLTGSGWEDILTCRTIKPIIGQTKTQLVALLKDNFGRTYEEYVLADGACDVFFDVADIDNDGRVEIVSAGFFTEKLLLIYSNNIRNDFTDKASLNIVEIDVNGGAFFDVKILDLDLDVDQNKELLVTNHQGENAAIKGAIYAYKLVGSVRNGVWTRSVIYDNFPVLKLGLNQAAPGSAHAFWPLVATQNTTRPYLYVSGDGSENAYVFKPSESGPLSYELIWSHYYKGYTVGGASLADVNGDGVTEFVVPAYESNKLYIYTFA